VAPVWLQIRVDLLEGRGEQCDPSPGRIFLVGPTHGFDRFATAIDAAFGRWDISHLHAFDSRTAAWWSRAAARPA
jgi:hypothetical protein